MPYKATFSLSQRWPLNTGLTVILFLKSLIKVTVHFIQYTCTYVYENQRLPGKWHSFPGLHVYWKSVQ
jgi:hypothetical protein